LLLDYATKEPIQFATVYDSLLQQGTHSDAQGIFNIDCQNRLRVSHVLFETTYIDCPFDIDTVYLEPKRFLLNTIEVTATKSESKLRKSKIIRAGVGNRKPRMIYEGIKEAALFVENPIKRHCFIHQVLFSFSGVKFASGGKGTIKDKDILLRIQIYQRSKNGLEPELPLLQEQIIHRLQANSRKLKVPLLSTKTELPPEGAFVAVEFLGYFEGEEFMSLDMDDLDVRKQFAPDLSSKHQEKKSFYRKTFSDTWDRVNVEMGNGFFNFNFGIELLIPNGE